MNPPFTRKQHVKKAFRAMLTERFRDYSAYANEEMNFFAYFILLADRFLQDGGRLAMVLPATILRQLSSKGIRTLLSQNYTIEFIIQSGYRLAFSESTAFREILFVARKTSPQTQDQPCVLARLETMPSESNVESLAEVLTKILTEGRITREVERQAHTLKLMTKLARQGEFQETDDWHLLLPGERVEGFALPQSSLLVPLGELGYRVVQGIRFHDASDRVDVKNTVVSRPRDVAVKMNWRIEKESEGAIEAVSTQTGLTARIPKSALRPTTRSPSGMTTMEIVDAPDYIVVDRFKGDEVFWDDPDPDAVLARRLPHLKSREAFLVAAGRNNVNLAAEGTHFLGFVSSHPIPPTWSFWSIETDSVENARLLALWWNSTFHLAQLIENRTEVGGSWMGWLKDDLVRLPVLNIAALSQNERDRLLQVYDTWKATPFPPLLDQLKRHFEGRVAIDSAIAKVIGAAITESALGQQYDALATRIEWLGNLITHE